MAQASSEQNQPAAPLSDPQEPVRVNHTGRNIVIAVIVIALIAVAVFFGVRAAKGGSDSAAKGSKSNPVKIGVVGATDPQWVEFQKEAEAAGIYVKIVEIGRASCRERV